MRWMGIILLSVMVSLAARGAESETPAASRLKISGDLRARFEADFDSQLADGSARQDRDRVRMRARLGLAYQASARFSFALRLRTGTAGNHQSPHLTIHDFDGGDTDDPEVFLDRWLIEAKGKGGRVWLGRDGLPFWMPNELYWDQDVTPVGLGLVIERDVAGGRLGLQGGYFTLPVGMKDFAGELGAMQLKYARGPFVAAVGLLAFAADPDDRDSAVLLRGNGRRDYTLWVVSLQRKIALGRGLTLGVDLMHNSEGYAATDPDPFTAAHHDEVDGHVLSLQYGGLGKRGDWLAAVYHARIETFAVNASYAQDDWVRWGSATETRASDLEGQELRFAYALGKTMNLVLRCYFVTAITTVEDGKRCRADFNYSF